MWRNGRRGGLKILSTSMGNRDVNGVKVGETFQTLNGADGNAELRPISF
jgi:hypothetical protein